MGADGTRDAMGRGSPRALPPKIPAMTFIDQLQAATRDNTSLLCVGLDPDPARFPPT